MIELAIIVVAGVLIVDVVYELCRIWLRHIEQTDSLERMAQRQRRHGQRP